MRATITVIPGDGVGPEVTRQAVKALKAISQRFGHEFDLLEGHLGLEAYKRFGTALTSETLENCFRSNAVFVGATTGGPPTPDLKVEIEIRRARVELAKRLDCPVIVRPVWTFAPLVGRSPLKPELVKALDMVIVRDFGWQFRRDPNWKAKPEVIDITHSYTRDDVEPILRLAFLLARSRRKNIALMQAADSLRSSMFWRDLFAELAPAFPDVVARDMNTDSVGSWLLRDPSSFDVIVAAESRTGDLLNNQAAVLMGSVGMGPGAWLGIRNRGVGAAFDDVVATRGIFEPTHGSAPRHAGKGEVNPVGAVLSVGMLLRISLKLNEEADTITQATNQVLEAGYATYDIAASRMRVVGTDEMGDRIAAAILGRST